MIEEIENWLWEAAVKIAVVCFWFFWLAAAVLLTKAAYLVIKFCWNLI